MDRLGFRIQLDLSEYFDDIRRLCWIFVDVNEHRFINDLIAHIKEVVPISGSFVLIFDNGILPFSESVHVLKEGDVVRVCRIEDGLFSSSITPPSKIETNGSVVSSEKLEEKHPGFLQNRRDASVDSVDASNYNDEAQLGSYEKGQSKKKHKRSFPKISISSISEEKITPEESINDSYSLINEINKHKSRKRKATNETVEKLSSNSMTLEKRVSRIEDGLFSSSITPPSKIKTNGSVVSSEKLEGKHPGFLQNRRDASLDSVDASNYNDEAQLGSYEKEHSKKSEKKHKRSFPKISISSISEGKITPEESINDSYSLINEINKHKSRKRKATNETVATPGL